MTRLLDKPVRYPNEAYADNQGVGMTSQRTRNRLVERLIFLGVTDEAVLDAIRVTPRHLFIDEALASRAYEDTALPIGYGQTISQPWVVAKMAAWLKATGSIDRVLEIGTGSGYQAAILGLLAKEVYSVERIEPLLIKAKKVIEKLALSQVHIDYADGFWGWPKQAPFDAIISAASPETLPESLIEQLKPGGRLVIPIGGETQKLMGYTRTESGYDEQYLGDVLFVPMLTGLDSRIEKGAL